MANPAGNTRNGKSKKTLKGEFGELPSKCHATAMAASSLSSSPSTRPAGASDDKIISLYARGMMVREIQAHLEEMYGTEVSPSLISSVTDAGRRGQGLAGPTAGSRFIPSSIWTASM